MIREAHNFILIVLPREETLPRCIVHALFHSTCHAHDRLRTAQVLICLKRHVAEQYSDILSIQITIRIEVIPISHKMRGKGEFSDVVRRQDVNSHNKVRDDAWYWKGNKRGKDAEKKTYILYVRRILSSKLLRYTEIMPSMKDFS